MLNLIGITLSIVYLATALPTLWIRYEGLSFKQRLRIVSKCFLAILLLAYNLYAHLFG